MKFQALRLQSCIVAITIISSSSTFALDSEVEVGLLNVSEDSNRFGRYTGLTEQDLYLDLNFSMTHNDGIDEYATFHGQNLGLDSRSMFLDWGRQGKYEAYIHFNQTPFNDFTGQSIFDGVGSGSLSLGAGWPAGNTTTAFDDNLLSSSLTDVEIGVLRRKLGLGTKVLSSNKNWTFSLDFSTEEKEGLQTLGGVIGNPGSGRVALLPSPVDYNTDNVSAALSYQGLDSHFNVTYRGSLFYNNYNAISWESPFNSSGGGTGNRGPLGQISLPPDNQMHQLSLSGGWHLFGTTRFSGMLSVAGMFQDETFLPGTVSFAPDPLPRNSLDGEVYQYNALLALSSRPLQGLNYRASYRLVKRDNQTPIDTFTNNFLNDSGNTPNETNLTNDPYSYEKHTFKLNGSYRLNRKARLNGYVAHEIYESDQSEVQETTEDKGKLKLNWRAMDNLQVAIGATASTRDGSAYETAANVNPVMRKYNISDRDRVGGSLNVSYQPTDRLSLSANLDLNEDDYDETVLGLTEASQNSLIIDASYQFKQELTAFGYIGRENYDSKQAGTQSANASSPDWWVENEDTLDTLGMGFTWQKNSLLELGADYSVTLTEGQINIRSNNANPTIVPFPDLESNLHSLKLYADYQFRKNSSVRVTYLYEDYDEDDWSIDGVTYDTIPQVLLLGEPNPSYEEHVVGISIKTSF